MWFARMERLGQWGLDILEVLGSSALFLVRMLWARPRFKKSLPLWAQQMYGSGVLPLGVILMSGVFIGMVVTLQGYNTLNKFGVAEQLGQLLALSVTRELGPVVTALLFAGRAGSALTAEIGLMKATEQLAAMEVMGVDPLAYVGRPRFWGVMTSVPILTLFFDMLAIFGGYCVAVLWLGLDENTFWSSMQSSVDFSQDVLNGVIKSFVFAGLLAWIALFSGWSCTPTAAGVARATTQTVVLSSMAVLASDYMLTSWMIGGW